VPGERVGHVDPPLAQHHHMAALELGQRVAVSLIDDRRLAGGGERQEDLAP
jgi:hypothetical protein